MRKRERKRWGVEGKRKRNKKGEERREKEGEKEESGKAWISIGIFGFRKWLSLFDHAEGSQHVKSQQESIHGNENQGRQS